VSKINHPRLVVYFFPRHSPSPLFRGRKTPTLFSSTPDASPARVGPNVSDEPSATADEKESNWKSTASATARLLLRRVRDSADTFGPLKSVAGSLCFILENREVRPPSRIYRLAVTGTPANEGEYMGHKNRWIPESKRPPDRSLQPFLKVISRRDQGKRSWNGKPVLSNIES